MSNFVAQGVSGGIMESLQGGNFGHGFAVAGLGALASPMIGQVSSSTGRVVTAAVVGGTISELTGGKFVDGAQSWAFQAAVGEALSENNQDVVGSADGQSTTLTKSINTDVMAGNFHTPDDAAWAAGVAYGQLGIDTRREFQVGIIRAQDGTYGYTQSFWPDSGSTRVVVSNAVEALKVRYGANFVAWAHGHFDGNLKFSTRGLDYTFATKVKPLYLYNQANPIQLRLLNSQIANSELQAFGGAGTMLSMLRAFDAANHGFSGVCVRGCN